LLLPPNSGIALLLEHFDGQMTDFFVPRGPSSTILAGVSPGLDAMTGRRQRSSRASRLEVSQRLPPIFSTSA
jgi:hypothetical protein